ncbi:Predicted acetyltransferase [Legionella busanensis]|uniref:Aminoglycoside N(6')-acetyltransferase type 1 n=1 Tax=Legionella busanensis TaxID=190655 RepID=A0A378KCZ0_9GAMM|nr:GNAT family N-acetyltransferase [Legionella busanensis]STX81485.1 Predicted acetyltransferase [Legionella busanensis]
MKIEIRQARERDYFDWIEMRKRLWPEASFDELKDLLHLKKAKDFVCYFAEVDGKLAGFIEIALRPYANGCSSSPVAFVEGIWVDEAFQKQGVGRMLAAKAEEWTRSHGIKELGSDTRIESEQSIHAHKKWGFIETERVVYFRKDTS